MKTVNPHNMESDAALLDRYVTRRDEAAFRQIVERHAGMVLGVARRRTGDTTLAEEAGQIVFTLLARKAPALRHLPPDKLGGWLHRTALLTAANLLRSEMRRRLHHERFTADAVSATAGPDESAWHAALPLVDEAIDSLPEADRKLLVQHFYQRRTFREMSEGTGRSEDAMRKRASRALERLSAFFKWRGVTLSAGAIMTGLSAHVTEAAPAGYAASVAAAAVSNAPSVSILTVISNTLATMAFTKITATAAAVAFFTPLGLHWSGNATTAPAPPPAAAAAQIKPGAGNGAGAVHPGSTAAASAAISGRSAALARFAQELARLTPPPADEQRLTELQRLVFALPEAELGPAFQLLRTSSAKAVLGPVASAIAARWAEFNPAEALRMARTLPKELQPAAWTGALQVWARRDFNAAFAWACAQPEGEDRNTQLDTVYNDLMKRDPAAALARLKEVPTAAKQKQYRLWTLEVWRNSDPDAALAWLNTNEPEESRDQAISQFISDWAGYRPDLSVAYAMKHLSNPYKREETVRFAFMQWASYDSAAAIDALVNLPPELQTASVARNAGPFIATSDVTALLEATRKLPSGDFRDALQASVATRIANTDLEQAKALAAGIKSVESRRQAANAIAWQWLKSDPAAAQKWIEASADLPDSYKKQLLSEAKK